MKQKPLDLQRIEAGIQNNPDIRKIKLFLFDRVGSTNSVALAMGDSPDGAMILAEAQDKGRGRLNRTWLSPHGVNLYFSLRLSPLRPVSEWPLFSLAAACGLVSAIRLATGLQSTIKWPNDVLVNHKKVAGILLESGRGTLVIGIGVNINWKEIPPELCATSLAIALGHTIDRNDFVLHLLAQLFAQVRLLESGEKARLLQDFSALCVSLGKPVRVCMPDKTIEGVAEQILEDGGLLLRSREGIQKALLGDLHPL